MRGLPSHTHTHTHTHTRQLPSSVNPTYNYHHLLSPLTACTPPYVPLKGDSIPPSSPGSPGSPSSPSSPVTPEGKRAEPSEFNQKAGSVGGLRPLGHRVGGKSGALRPQGNSLSIITKKNYLADPVARTGLPPLCKEPLTPTVKGAQVNRDEGDRLLRATGQSPRVSSPPPRTASPPVQKPSRFNPARCSTPP